MRAPQIQLVSACKFASECQRKGTEALLFVLREHNTIENRVWDESSAHAACHC